MNAPTPAQLHIAALKVACPKCGMGNGCCCINYRTGREGEGCLVAYDIDELHEARIALYRMGLLKVEG